MRDEEEHKHAKWKEMSLQEFFDNLPKPTLGMKIYMLGEKIKRIFNKGRTTTTRGHSRDTKNINIPHQQEDISLTFRESQQFDPEKAYIERKQEDAYLKSAGFTRDDLIVTPEEYIRRKQEDAYSDLLPRYRKEDHER